MPMHLTESCLKNLEPRPRRFRVADDKVNGFGVRAYPNGTKVFRFECQLGRRQISVRIGEWPAWSVTAARERARELRRMVDMGLDPTEERNKKNGATVADLIQRYEEEHLPHLAPRNASDQKSMLHRYVAPHWGKYLVKEIEPRDVNKLLTMIAEGTVDPKRKDRPKPVRANRTGEVLRKMFNLSIEWKMRKDNPAASFRRRLEQERERFLTQDELARLATVLEADPDDRTVGIIRMCMLTGGRLGEIRCSRFEHFHLEHMTWTKPAAMTKQRKIHRLPISEQVAVIVRQRRLVAPKGCPWLFQGEIEGQPVQEIRRGWHRIRAAAGLPDVRIHDLRHTFASLLVSRGASLEMIAKLLGHAQVQTTQRYAHLADAPLRGSVDAVAEMLRPRPKVVASRHP
ncbi:MAG: site-specific integrase [Alphaproteobacteria bacterium]|nr:site-specific integrase [Alphaproteobacteria bacterium]